MQTRFGTGSERPGNEQPSEVEGIKATQRRGGLAGIAGSVALIAAFLPYPIFGLPEPDDVKSLTDYPELATGRVIENSFYLLALVLWAVHFLAIGRVVRGPATGARLFAPAIAVFGLVPMAAGSLIHVSTSELSALYVDSTTAADQGDVILAWQSLQALFNTLLVVGVAIVPLAMLGTAWALFRTETVGRVVGGVALALGIVGSIGGIAGVVGGSGSPGVPVAVLAMLVFHGLVGWRLTR